MDYTLYLRTDEWKQVKANRLAFDNWQCAFCHTPLTGRYETHHINYSALGHEDMERDVVSLCSRCHAVFHEVWERKEYWHDSPLTHWQSYSLKDTAQLCADNIGNDYILGGKYNLCSDDTISQFVDQYYQDHDITVPVYICETDVKLFFRNQRYYVWFKSAESGEDLEVMLDRMFGKKGGKGGNPRRADARRFFTKHKMGRAKQFCKDNENILILESEVNKILEKETVNND